MNASCLLHGLLLVDCSTQVGTTGLATEKALLPNFVLVRGTVKLVLDTETALSKRCTILLHPKNLSMGVSTSHIPRSNNTLHIN